MKLERVDVRAADPQRFVSILEDRWPDFAKQIQRAQDMLAGRVIWNVNSTATGGGVAEMLRPLVGYIKGAGLDANWIVIGGTPDFFRITKRIHNNLHGAPGDGGELGPNEAETYERTLEASADELASVVASGDVVLLHDPQTIGLIPALSKVGALVIWRCHVGLDTPNERARTAWRFLKPWVENADAYVFSREAFVWDDLDRDKIAIIPPSIDVFTPKNQDLDEQQIDAILRTARLIEGSPSGTPLFVRSYGGEGRVTRRARMLGAGPIPSGVRTVAQVSRWDRLKDPLGVMEGFAEHVEGDRDVHLMLAGPAVEGVADDPEGTQVLDEAVAAWRGLDADTKERIHLAALPMDDDEENAAIVNALQRRADVVVQKSLAEGFGLTVAEAMWKARPVVASRIGGIQDQIVDGETGLLVDDPSDLAAFGGAVNRFLSDPAFAEQIGKAGRDHVRDEFLGPRHLMQYVTLVGDLISSP